MANHICIEACVASAESARAAEAGGADRLELNLALELDGLTPTIGLLREIKNVCVLPVIVMIRPRSYGFMYSEAEFRIMQSDIDLFLQEGVAGFAFGILTQDKTIDRARTRSLVQQVGPGNAVFHRAFDVVAAPSEALEQLIDCGIQRILTSGMHNSALEGATAIRSLVDQAANRIEILPGGGIAPFNVASLISRTGCTQIHGTFKKPASSSAPKTEILSSLDLLRQPPPPGTDQEIVAQVREAVDAL